MKYLLSLSFLLLLLVSWKQKDTLDNATICKETDGIYSKLVTIRRDFHANPELAGKEVRTREFIKNYLLDLGLDVKTDIYGNSVIGIMNGGKKGKKIAWRTEMDALPNNFPDNADFKSKINGVQHGCGHDVHLAIGLGIAEILSKHKESIQGTVFFIFQPEEETFVGAKKLIENGLLSKIHPDEIYTAHITALPVGKIAAKPNEVFAYQKRIKIQFNKNISKEDANALATKISMTLSRSQPNSKPWEIQHIVEPNIGLGNPNTIYKSYLIMDRFNIYSRKDTLNLEAYIYETDKGKLKNILPAIRRIIDDEKYKDKLIALSYVQENPTVVNNVKLTAKAVKTLSAIYGNNLFMPDYGQVPYFNDDFAYYQQKIPGVYFLLGGFNFEKGIIAMNHSPNFNVDEESIRVSVRSFSSLIINRLN